MKAAVLHDFGEQPRYEDFPDPRAGEGEVLVQVKAVALENVDKAMAKGLHYASRQFLPQLPAIIGHSGIGVLADGQLVGFGGVKPPYGAMAEKVVIPQGNYFEIPEGVDAAVAAVVPSSALTSYLPLRWLAKLQPDETVWINGATGSSGKIAIQIAKLLGAGRIIGTGRNEKSLQQIRELGADVAINLNLSEKELAHAFANETEKGCDIILDFLWGYPTETLLQALVPTELGFAKRRIRLVQLGEMAGSSISLPAAALRTSGLEIYGGGSIPHEVIPESSAQVWDFIKGGKLHMDIERVPLEDVRSAWDNEDVHGKRIVLVL
ncbi:MAG TPA: zinc-binding alcohol dehydrogenase family protein [Anaerolineales bacterium]|nr:zinc-binding alcohol dehydrogenase family protein [Anaerolineales bacterium]